MGCGVSQSIIEGDDDRQKSDAFLKLCAAEKNPIAGQLNSYFNALMSECLYKSQGNTSGYERLLARRPTEVTVNRNKLAAQRHGIGHKPLTVQGVNDIMNLFLGHAIKSLEQRKWSGEFNYVLKQPPPVSLNSPAAENISAGNNPFSSMGPSAQGSPRDYGFITPGEGSPNHSRGSRKRKAQSASAASRLANPEAGATGLPANAAGDSSAAAIPKSAVSHTTMPASAMGQSNTLLFIDRGDGSRKNDDPLRQWRLELTGHITFPSVDGALTLLCDSEVAFLFFTCDTEVPRDAENVELHGESNIPQQSALPPSESSSPPRKLPSPAQAVEADSAAAFQARALGTVPASPPQAEPPTLQDNGPAKPLNGSVPIEVA